MEEYIYDIAIVIPIYNGSNYIEEMMASILNQKTKFSYQIILVDDGSTDSTLIKLKNYQAINPNVFVIQQENRGAGAARNQGIKIASSEYLYFCDSDDYILPNIFEVGLTNIKKMNLDMYLFSGKSFFDENYNDYDFCPIYIRPTHTNISGENFLLSSEKEKKYFVIPTMYIIKKSLLEKNNLYFPEGIIYEDNYFTTVALLQAEKVSSTDEIFYMRRIRDNSVMTSRKIEVSIRSYDILINSFSKYACSEKKSLINVNILDNIFLVYISEYYSLTKKNQIKLEIDINKTKEIYKVFYQQYSLKKQILLLYKYSKKSLKRQVKNLIPNKK